jgi:peptidoglycan/xylan/chitin deacetylase (PgdA/CDA1 family)
MNQIISLIILISFSLTSFANEIAITFDDSPREATGYFNGVTRAKKLLLELKKANIKEVAFFSVSSKINKEGKKRIEMFARAGHIIANHTHNHPDFNQLGINEYIDDFKKADELLSKFSNYQKWFRFPYLREGNEVTKRDIMRETLKNLGYKNAYITVNNYDWYMENQFQEAIKKNQKLDFKKLKNYYVENLINAIEFYDQMALKHLGRSPKHVLLLHETDLNALFIGDLTHMLESKGWKIISPKDAYKDDISNFFLVETMKFNPGRIGEIAFSKGQKKNLWHESCDEDFLDKEFKLKVLQ